MSRIPVKMTLLAAFALTSCDGGKNEHTPPTSGECDVTISAVLPASYSNPTSAKKAEQDNNNTFNLDNTAPETAITFHASGANATSCSIVVNTKNIPDGVKLHVEADKDFSAPITLDIQSPNSPVITVQNGVSISANYNKIAVYVNNTLIDCQDETPSAESADVAKTCPVSSGYYHDNETSGTQEPTQPFPL